MTVPLKGMPPIVGDKPHTLILGSMPSSASIEKQQYYGHPRNAFWPLLARLTKFEYSKNYAVNVEQAKRNKIAIWDVIATCERVGSLDSAIRKGSEVLNPLKDFLDRYPSILHIGLNGGLAAKLFKQHFDLDSAFKTCQFFTLPSSSPANARMNFEEKVTAWQPCFYFPKV